MSQTPAIVVDCHFGRFTVQCQPEGAKACREAIIITPRPESPEVEIRVLRLALYDIALGYTNTTAYVKQNRREE